jgi:sodium-type flagellar protein MotY
VRKIKLPRVVAGVIGLLVPSLSLQASSFGAGLENSQWYVASSIFECRVVHTIPQFGQAVFFHEAGEPLKFQLEAARVLMRAGEAALVVEAPPWRPGIPVQDLGLVAALEQPRSISVDARRSTLMMDGLLQGMLPTFTRKARYIDQSVRVSVSPINFKTVYQDYLDCAAGLLPMNFRQAERSAILFPSGKVALTDDAKRRLDNIVEYLKADPSVTAIYVDGHSDAAGRRLTNRQMSKERAEIVSRYLIDAGLNEEMITTRYHSDRYPVVDNRTADNRARNRRATVRLERGGDPHKKVSMVEARSSN